MMTFVSRNFILIVLGTAVIGLTIIILGGENLGVAFVHGVFALLSLLILVSDTGLTARIFGAVCGLFFLGSTVAHIIK